MDSRKVMSISERKRGGGGGEEERKRERGREVRGREWVERKDMRKSEKGEHGESRSSGAAPNQARGTDRPLGSGPGSSARSSTSIDP
jgi:hypothetical protein